MAYQSEYLTAIKFAGGAGGNHVWLLMTEDANAAVTATDYITDATEKGMTVGDIVLVVRVGTLPATSPSGVSLMYVSAIDADGNATLDDTAVA
jgi:hypothetical protein